MKRLAARLFHFLVLDEGSTRPAALVRLGLVPLLWSKWAGDFLQYLDPAPHVRVIGLSFYASTTLLFFGVWTRVAAAWAGLTMLAVYYWIGHVDGKEPYVHHHTGLLVIATALIALTPSGRSLSFDRWWALRRAHGRGGAAPEEWGPLWGQRLLALQVSVLYLATAYDKLTPAFLSGARLQHHFMYLYLGSNYPDGSWYAALCQVLAVATVALELALGVGLWIPRARPVLIPLGMLFHGILFVTLPVSTFSLTMWLLYLAFLDPAAVHRFVDQMVGGPRTQPQADR